MLMRDDLISEPIHMPDISRAVFRNATIASLLKCRYFSLLHPRGLKGDVCEAIESTAHSYGPATEICRRGELRKIAVCAGERAYTLEFDQAPIDRFLELPRYILAGRDFVTTIKVPRSPHGSALACTAGLLGIVDNNMLVALTTNEAYPGSRIRFGDIHWRGRSFSALRYSERTASIEYLNIPKSICAQVINAYQEKRFVAAVEAQRRLMPLRSCSVRSPAPNGA